MESIEIWWQGLGGLTRCFALSAAFFSVLFLWQCVSILLGVGGDGHDCHPHSWGDTDHGTDSHDGQDGSDNAAFTLVSVRSVIAFGTLFSFSGFFYLHSGTSVGAAIAFSVLWGLAAMITVSYVLFKLLQLQETGNTNLWQAVGEEGTVYISIPQDGLGQVRIMVGNSLAFVKARSADGHSMDAGIKIRVVGVADSNTVMVEPAVM